MDRYQAAQRMNTSIIGASVTKKDVRDFILKARIYPFAGIAVEASFLPYAHSLLHNTGINTVGIANYPLGGATLDYSLRMVRWCFENGADQMDINVPIALLRSGKTSSARNYLKQTVEIGNGRIVKGVIWSDQMEDQEILDTCYLMAACGVDYVKTNPGFQHTTTYEVVSLIKKALGNKLKIMVAGGVRTTEQMLEFFELGADIVTTSTLDSVLAELPEPEMVKH